MLMVRMTRQCESACNGICRSCIASWVLSIAECRKWNKMWTSFARTTFGCTVIPCSEETGSHGATGWTVG
eukprot:5978255-Amphidinium_carterae.1